MSGVAGAERQDQETPFPVGGGDLGDLIRAFDWSTTSLGPISDWPQSLKTATNLLLLSPVPIVLLWGADGVMIYNQAYSGFAGGRHPQILGSKVLEGWPEVADFNANVMKVGLAGGTLAYASQELILDRSGQPEQMWADLFYSPVLDESNRPAGVIAVVLETTERVMTERRQRESEERFRALVDATSDVIYRMNPDWTQMTALDGRGVLSDTASPSVAWMGAYLLPEDQPSIRAAIDEAVRRKGVFQLEHRVRQADGVVGWTASRAVPLFDAEGDIVEWFGAASDISERRRAEEHLKLMVNELNHRVKNTLAMTQAIAAQTFRSADNLSQAQVSFTARLMALAQANDLLTGERGVGASLRGVLEQTLKTHSPDPERSLAEGPDLMLSPKTALSLTLASHELATNSLKYGAWSTPSGQVAVRWSIHRAADGEAGGDRLRLEWRESGGPPVTAPERRGFGSRLIERGLAAEMGGEVKLMFEPEGLICQVDAPLAIYGEGQERG